MAIEKFKASFYRIVARLHQFSPAERYGVFLKELEDLPDSKERDLMLELVPTVRGLWEAGVDTSNVHTAPHVVHQHFYQSGTNPEFMEDKTVNKQTITGGTFNAPVGLNQAFKDCYNTAEKTGDPRLQDSLKTLVHAVEVLHPQLSDADKSKAQRKLLQLTDEAAQKAPDNEQLALSGKGLVEAAKTCAEMAPPVILAVKAVLGFFGVPLP